MRIKNKKTNRPHSTGKGLVQAALSICFLYATACGDKSSTADTDEFDIDKVPECHSGTTASPDIPDAGEDSDTGDSTVLFIPASCESSLFNDGIDRDCAVQAKGTLTIGDETYNLTSACMTITEIADWATGIVYQGFNIRILAGQKCLPLLSVGILDLDRYPDAPFTIDLDEPFCSDSGVLHEASVVVETEDDCYTLAHPATGQLAVEDLEYGVVYKGTVEAEMQSFTETKTTLTVDFELRGLGWAQSIYHADHLDLCDTLR
jgi:hypothetical protein